MTQLIGPRTLNRQVPGSNLLAEAVGCPWARHFILNAYHSPTEKTLKTLFNIVEDRFNFFFKLWCLCYIMMFRRVNKTAGMQKFWNWCSHYQKIYDWISPLNKRSGWPFILTLTEVYGENEYGESGQLFIFSLLKHNFFSGLHFYTLPKTLIACRAMQLRFLKVKTLLNNAFTAGLMFAFLVASNNCMQNRLQ